MKNKIISLIFLIAIIGNIYAYPMYEPGNIMSYITDVGVSRGSVYDLSEISPEDDWHNKNVAAKGFTPPVVAICDNVTNYCRRVDPETQDFVPIPTRRQEIRTPPVDYFSQNCIDRGFKKVTGFPFTYKCSEDKTGFYVCYKRGSSYYIEPDLKLFTILRTNTRNRLKNAICDPDPVQNVSSEPTEIGNTDTQPAQLEIILDSDMFPSLVEKVNYIGYDSESVGAFGYMPIPKTRRSIPYFTLNYETEEKYQINDTNVTVYLDSRDFNFNSEIYALVATPENYNDLISEINNFIKTQNSEYVNSQQYLELPISNGYSVDCYCKQKDTPSSRYIFTTGWGFTPLIGNPNSTENKNIINEFCQEVCVTEKIANDNLENINQNTSKIYEYDLDNYDLEIVLPFEVLNNYKLTKTQSIDKIKFLPNGNTFQFTIERNNPNKRFVIVFLQKDNKRLNISYSNFYVLNNDEVIKYSHCEANRTVLSFFCNKYMDSRCGIFKSCFNEYDLNFNAIDLSEYVYSIKGNSSSVVTGNTTVTPNPNPVTPNPNPVTPNPNTTTPTQTTYYTATSNTGAACSNAGIIAGQWACVCTSYRGTKSVIAAKCTTNNGLVLYSSSTCNASTECNAARLLDNAKVNTCYTKSSTLCR